MKRFLVAAVMLFALTACGSKINQDNFNQIKNSTPYADVVKLLGEPQSSQGGGAFGINTTTAIWDDGKHQITIVFINEKVVSKVFGDATAEKPAGKE